MDKFLKKYYKQLHFNSMPAEVRARFYDWVKQGTLTNDMKNWVRDYLEHDPARTYSEENPAASLIVRNGRYVQKALPDPEDNAQLSDEDARKLFIAFQNAFAGMASDLSSFQDNDHQSRDFVNQYFGAGKLFKTSPAKPECRDGINKILDLLNRHSNLKNYIVKNTQNSEGKPVFESDSKLNELLTKCSSGQYDTDASVQKKIRAVAETLSNVVGWYSSIDQNSTEYKAIYVIKNDLDNVLAKDAFAMDAASIPATALSNFRSVYAKENKTGLLQTLYFNKTIRDRFGKYDNGAITGPINKAEEAVNWQDKSKDNYVDPKVSDVLTPLQRLEEWASDTYADTLKKYEQLRGAPIFRRQEAKDIFKAIDKNKIKPVDGLDGLLKKKADIEGKLNNPVARQHFKWFVETMEPIAAKMPKAVAGAWKNARQMKAVIQEIILKATDPKNDDPQAIEKAETAMEIMTAMKYGMMTSKVMDAMRGTEFSIFSDGKLSWNKNEGINFVTTAFDKSVKAAFEGVGYGVTILGNTIRMSGRQFKNKNNQNGRLAERFNAENTDKQNALRNQNTADTNTITAKNNEINALNTGATPINAGNLSARETQRDNIHNRMQQHDQIRQNNRAGFDAYNAGQNVVNEHNNNMTELRSLDARLNDPVNGLNKQVADKEMEFRNPATYAGMPAAVANALALQLQQELSQLKQQQQEANQEYQNKLQSLRDPQYQQSLRNARSDMTANQTAYNDYNAADAAYNADAAAYNDLNDRITQFNNATQEIQELNTSIAERNYALSHWQEKNTNMVLYLENYWNFLQTGQTRTFRLSTKKAEAKFKANNVNDALLMRHIARHSLAA